MERELVVKRLAWIEVCVERLRRLAKPEQLAVDPIMLAFVEHTLQTAIQGAIDVAAVIVGERKLGEPDAAQSLFRLLAQDGWLTGQQAEAWQKIVGFRNVIVHRYLEVNPEIVRAVLESKLGDLTAFVHAVRDKVV